MSGHIPSSNSTNEGLLPNIEGSNSEVSYNRRKINANSDAKNKKKVKNRKNIASHLTNVTSSNNGGGNNN